MQPTSAFAACIYKLSSCRHAVREQYGVCSGVHHTGFATRGRCNVRTPANSPLPLLHTFTSLAGTLDVNRVGLPWPTITLALPHRLCSALTSASTACFCNLLSCRLSGCQQPDACCPAVNRNYIAQMFTLLPCICLCCIHSPLLQARWT
jgi:hypothetical protein